MNRAAFVPAKELQLGDVLLLSSESNARVTSLEVEESEGSSRFKTYNFEVADFHTYFVGDAGAWVHNTGSLCDRLWAAYNTFLDKGKDIVEAFLACRIEFIDSQPNTHTRKYHMSRAFGDLLDIAYKDYKKGAIPADAQLWSSTDEFSWTENMWRHWLDHERKFRDNPSTRLKNPFEYLDYLRNTAQKTMDPTYLIKYKDWINTRGIPRTVMVSRATKLYTLERQAGTATEQVSLDASSGLFFVQITSGSKAGAFKTLFFIEGSPTYRLSYLQKQ